MGSEEAYVTNELEEDILRSLRRISRAIDIHSRNLATKFGLTGPQLVVLRLLGQRGPMKPSEIAIQVALSQATITGIVDRLTARQLVTRERNAKDRRLVTVTITEAGRALTQQAPSPLQERFLSRLHKIDQLEQTAIRDKLRQIVCMMDGDKLEVDATLVPPIADGFVQLGDAIGGLEPISSVLDEENDDAA